MFVYAICKVTCGMLICNIIKCHKLTSYFDVLLFNAREHGHVIVMAFTSVSLSVCLSNAGIVWNGNDRHF